MHVYVHEVPGVVGETDKNCLISGSQDFWYDCDGCDQYKYPGCEWKMNQQGQLYNNTGSPDNINVVASCYGAKSLDPPSGSSGWELPWNDVNATYFKYVNNNLQIKRPID